jgi:hypothetical protein
MSVVYMSQSGAELYQTVQTRAIWKVANAYVVTVTVAQIGQSQRQLARGVVSGQQKWESYSLATTLYKIKQVIGMSDLDMDQSYLE